MRLLGRWQLLLSLLSSNNWESEEPGLLTVLLVAVLHDEFCCGIPSVDLLMQELRLLKMEEEDLSEERRLAAEKELSKMPGMILSLLG